MAGAARAVQESIHIHRQIIVNDSGYAGEIQAPCGRICRTQYPDFTLFKLMQCMQALCLIKVGRKRCRKNLMMRQNVTDSIGIRTMIHKYNGLLDAVFVQQFQQCLFLILSKDVIGFDVLAELCLIQNHFLIRLWQKGFDILMQRRGKHSTLPFHLLKNLLCLFTLASACHHVCFINDCQCDALQVQLVLMNQIQQPAWCANHQFSSLFQEIFLLFNRHAANQAGRMNACIQGKPLGRLFHLNRQLPGRGQNKHLGLSVFLDAIQCRQQIRRGLASSGMRLDIEAFSLLQ